MVTIGSDTPDDGRPPLLDVQDLDGIADGETFVDLSELTGMLGYPDPVYVSSAVIARLTPGAAEDAGGFVRNLRFVLGEYEALAPGARLGYLEIDVPEFVASGELRRERVIAVKLRDERGMVGLLVCRESDLDDDEGVDWS